MQEVQESKHAHASLHIDCSKMPSTLLDLPTEIHLHIFPFVKPYELLHSVSLVNQHFRSCVEDVFRNDILPSLWIILDVTLPEPCDLSATGGGRTLRIAVNFLSTDEKGWAYYKLNIKDEDCEQASGKWKAIVWESLATMKAQLPTQYDVIIPDKIWKGFTAEQDRHGDTLKLRWKPLIARYLEKAKNHEEIAFALTVRGSQAEAIYSSMFSY